MVGVFGAVDVVGVVGAVGAVDVVCCWPSGRYNTTHAACSASLFQLMALVMGPSNHEQCLPIPTDDPRDGPF